jgi:hypothetical protein
MCSRRSQLVSTIDMYTCVIVLIVRSDIFRHCHSILIVLIYLLLGLLILWKLIMAIFWIDLSKLYTCCHWCSSHLNNIFRVCYQFTQWWSSWTQSDVIFLHLQCDWHLLKIQSFWSLIQVSTASGSHFCIVCSVSAELINIPVINHDKADDILYGAIEW